MQANIRYEFSAKLWKSSSPGAWFFLSIPKEISKEIRENLRWQEEGWGRMKVSACIQDIKWNTAIWFDTRMDTYLLPLKSEIRKKTGLKPDDEVVLSISI